ncbi:MAG TPA: HEAT repeat domain-containing protein [Gemmataceae bacterium]|jgi:HEAT repeat protein|nr:HEAT repeat domain-containing protein [Gemmataceae bacterium]
MRPLFLAALAILSLVGIGMPLRAQEKEKTVGGKKIDQWIAEIRSPDPGVREKAIRAVTLYDKKEGRKACRALIVELADQDVSLRVNAVMALGMIGFDEENLKRGVEALARLVANDPQQIVQLQAAATLSTIGPDAKAAIPQLVLAVRNTYTSWEVRKAAAAALRTVALAKEGPDPRAFPALIGTLGDISTEVRLEALMSLIILGAPSDSNDLQKAKLAFEKAIKDKDKVVSIWARVALMRIDKISELHLIAIGQMLKALEVPVRVNAASALGAMGPEAGSQVSHLIEALNDTEETVIAGAIAALGLMGDEGEKAISALTPFTTSQNEFFKLLAIEAITKISDKNARPKKEVLKPDLKKPDPKKPKP